MILALEKGCEANCVCRELLEGLTLLRKIQVDLSGPGCTALDRRRQGNDADGIWPIKSIVTVLTKNSNAPSISMGTTQIALLVVPMDRSCASRCAGAVIGQVLLMCLSRPLLLAHTRTKPFVWGIVMLR